MKYQAALFDLDGTLTDPKVGITKSIAYALAKFGILEKNLDTFIPFIGPPLKESFMKYYFAGDAKKAERAVDYYREYFAEQGMYENMIYPSVPDVLQKLKSLGVLLGIATSKALVLTTPILSHFEIDSYFSVVVGATLDGKRSKKADIIAEALQQLPKYLPKEIIMIGDRKHDIEGAAANGINSIAVTYGYGSYEELEQAKPTYITDSVEKIIPIIKE
jgi:phosphoglycolate phosphatase